MNTLYLNKGLKVILVCCLAVVFFMSYPLKPSWGQSVPAIYCGSNHSLALKEDGTVWAWGNNGNGQLGDGSSNNRSQPIQVQNLRNIKAIACKFGFSYALDAKGTLYGWGRNGYAAPQLRGFGFDSRYDVNHPIVLNLPISANTIACSFNQFCAYEPHTNILAVNTNSEFIQNYMEKISIETDTVTFKSVIPCNQGWLALDDNGRIWHKQGINYGSIQVNDLNDIIGISGDYHYAAIKSDGSVWTWGNNGSGQLGDGTQISRQTPQKVRGIADVIQITATGSKTVALKKDGTVWMWGLCGVLDNSKGEGYAVVDNTRVVSEPARITGLSNIKSIAAGHSHCLAIRDDGTVWAWGSNNSGQLGNGTYINSEKPLMIKDFNVLTPVAKEKQP